MPPERELPYTMSGAGRSVATVPPSGVNPNDFEAALRAFGNFVGERWMVSGDGDVDLLRTGMGVLRRGANNFPVTK